MIKPNINAAKFHALENNEPNGKVLPPETSGMPLKHEKIEALISEDHSLHYMFEEVTPDRYHSVTEEEVQEASAKLLALKHQITQKKHEFLKRRKKSRNSAFFFRVLTAALASIVTILLGIDFGVNQKFMNNIALIISVGMTVLTISHRFFDSKALWVQYTYTTGQLDTLLFNIGYLEECRQSLRLKQVEYLRYRYDQLMAGTLKFIVSVRSEE